MRSSFNAAKATFKAAVNRVARLRFLAPCFANESATDRLCAEVADRDRQRAEFGNLLVYLRHTLGEVVPEMANTVEPDGFLDALVNHLGGKEKATAWWANAWQGVSMPHDVKSAMDGIGASKHPASLNAHAASKLAANSTTKVGARADSATADDHADSYEWHDKAAQQHREAAVNNPDMAELHQKVRDWHAGQMRAHDDAETEKVNSDPAREEQRSKLMSLVGENRMIQPRYGEAPAHVDPQKHADALAASADSLSGFLDKASALKRREREGALQVATETQRQVGFMKTAANSASRFTESNFLRPVRANETLANAKGTPALPVGSTTFPDRADTMKKHGLKIGQKVQADANYGGAKGTVGEFSPSGSHVLVDHDDGGKGWYHAGDLEECDCAKDEEGKEEGEKGNEGNSEGASKGWATRKGGATDAAYNASDEAHAKSGNAKSFDDHEQASKLHAKAAELHREAAKAHSDSATRSMIHNGQAVAHDEKAKMHSDSAKRSAIKIGYESTSPNESLANEGAVCEWVCVSNEVKVDGNWVQLSPYGDFPHTGGTQRVTKEDAQNCVNEFTSLLNAPQRIMGIPFYIGHPDHPEFRDKYPDTKAYGRIKELEARDDGLWGNVKWSTAGKNMVNEEQFHGHSVNWRVRKDKQGMWRPFSIKSVGFTNAPNLPVQPITHANEVQDGDVENDLLAAAR